MASIAVCCWEQADKFTDCWGGSLKGIIDNSKLEVTNLPLSDVLHSLSERSPETGAQLQGITSYLNDVVDKSTHGRQGKGRGEEHHVAELNEHLLVVLKCSLFTSNVPAQKY